jgi:EAL domain-containing protein (putative c-di-GMP-specific phosphodiesterase class I)
MQGPGTFVGLAEETELILDIGHWARRQVALRRDWEKRWAESSGQ